jgi:hypothetical protein
MFVNGVSINESNQEVVVNLLVYVEPVLCAKGSHFERLCDSVKTGRGAGRQGE